MNTIIVNTESNSNSADALDLSTDKNKSCENLCSTEVVNALDDIDDLVRFQSSSIWSSESFTFNFQDELIQVLADRVAFLKSSISDTRV